MNNDVLKSFAQRAKRRLIGKDNVVKAKIKTIQEVDDDFRSRAISLLENDEVVTNPVSYLIDERVYKNLGEEAKERYLLSTLDKFASLRDEFERRAKTAL